VELTSILCTDLPSKTPEPKAAPVKAQRSIPKIRPFRYCFSGDHHHENGRALFAQELVAISRRPNKDEDPLIAGYYQYLMDKEKAPAFIKGAVHFQDDLSLRTIVRSAILGDFKDKEIAGMMRCQEQEIHAFRRLFFDPELSK
jgi:hypothetical protein